MRDRMQAVRQLLRWSRRAQSLRPVFIVGEMRSGTSILYRVLLRHPAFAPHRFHLTEPHAVHALTTQPRLDAAPRSFRDFFHGDERPYEELVAGVRSIAPLRAPAVKLARRRPESVTLFRASLGGVAVRAFVAAATEARGCRRLVDKTATNLGYSRRLLAVLPEAKLLYIVRHPVDTFSSYWRRYRNDPEAAWAAVSVADFSRRWTTNVNTALALAAERPDSFCVVRYERFTADPGAEFAAICRFLSEPAEEEALELWEGRPEWPPNPRLMDEIVPKTKDWREYASLTDATALEESLAVPMAALGYLRYTEPGLVGSRSG